MDDNIVFVQLGAGYIATFNSTKPFSKERVSFAPEGEIFEGIYRVSACFTRSFVTDNIKDIPPETQNLLCKNGETYTLYYFVAENGCRCSFSGGETPSVVLETGDFNYNVTQATCFFTISGKNVYRLFKEAARIISGRFKNVKLLKDKPLPTFIDKIGFCTYNAFNNKISDVILYDFLTRVKENGQKIGWMLLDDGWLSSTVDAMADFEADSTKFPNGLKGFVDTVKTEYGIDRVLAWHTFMGYWTGLDPTGFRKYELKHEIFDFPDDGTQKEISGNNSPLNSMCNFYPHNIKGKDVYFANDIYLWYNDFYKFLSGCGICGTKVDAFGWVEVVNRNNGGRVMGTEKFVTAVQSAGKEWLSSNNLYCSCNTNDFFFASGNGALIRSSEDYLPDDEQSHGNHIFYNSHVSIWMGEFFLCDFDMFQSGNMCGEFHAIARSISGGPIYFTDNAGGIDYNIIRMLATSDGDIPVLKSYAHLTEDCIFKNKTDGFLKLFNQGENSYVLGIFNCENVEKEENVTFEFLPDNEIYAAYSFLNGFIGVVDNNGSFVKTLYGLTADAVSFVPVCNGIAVIGEKGKILPAEFTSSTFEGDYLNISCKEDADVIVYCEKRVPNIIEVSVEKDQIMKIEISKI